MAQGLGGGAAFQLRGLGRWTERNGELWRIAAPIIKDSDARLSGSHNGACVEDPSGRRTASKRNQDDRKIRSKLSISGSQTTTLSDRRRGRLPRASGVEGGARVFSVAMVFGDRAIISRETEVFLLLIFVR